jgi:ice-binding like protein/invasin-like protein
MAMSATIVLNQSVTSINRPSTATLTISNSGAAAVNVLSILPMCTEDMGGVALSFSVIPLETNSITTVPAGGSLLFSFTIAPFASSTGPIGLYPGSYPITAQISCSDGSLFDATSAVANPLTIVSSYAVLGASAVTGSTGGGSTLTGNLGIYPNNSSSITNFPPSTYTGVENAANAAAQAAQAAALSFYTMEEAYSPYTAIPAALDGQTLAAGHYTEGSGTFNLAASGTGTLTLTGSATDVFVFKAASTLVTGAGGTPVITLTGGALAQNVYWIVGSSATINSGHAGTFNGNIIANTSITVTSGGTVNGSMVALNGAVTLSATTAANSNASISGGSVPANLIVYPIPQPGIPTLANSQVSISPASVSHSGGTATATLTLLDAGNNPPTSDNYIVAFGLAGGTAAGSFGTVTNNENGTFTSTFTASGSAGSGTVVTATINTGPVASTAAIATT